MLRTRRSSHSEQGGNSSDCERIPPNLWNPKFHYRLQDSRPLLHILSQISPVHALRSHILEISFNITPHLRPGVPSCLFPSSFAIRALRSFHFSPIRATCPAHLTLIVNGACCPLIDLPAGHRQLSLLLLDLADGHNILPCNSCHYGRLNLKHRGDNLECYK